MLLLLACTPDPIDTIPPAEDTAQAEPVEPADCATTPVLPAAVTTLTGFSGAEDFAFDQDGYLLSVDGYGNLTRENQAGDTEVIFPDVSSFAAGTALLPDGSVVIADAETGSLVRITMEGGYTVLLSGLAYPNGVDIGLDGFIYVAEQNTGQIRQVDPDTGAFTIIATGLYNPNGLTFGPGHETLYVGSFGGGTVHALARTGDGFAEPTLLGVVPGINTDYPAPCEGHAAGESCLFTTGGVGVCEDDGEGSLECTDNLDFTACDGMAAGDACLTDLLGESIQSTCTETRTDSGEMALFCPRAESSRLESCADKSIWDSCGAGGYCEAGWEGELVCIRQSDYDAFIAGCEAKEIGAACVALWPAGPWEGTCAAYPQWGYPALCEPYVGLGTEGGLDGINADECGNVYVTEYITGTVWAFRDGGTSVEVAAKLPSSWIPNMHWGSGVGGWEEDVLYVMDRDQGRVFGLELGLRGREMASQP